MINEPCTTLEPPATEWPTTTNTMLEPPLAMVYFPFAEKDVATAQYAKLMTAKKYMRERGILATIVGSTFKYECATGSVLGEQR